MPNEKDEYKSKWHQTFCLPKIHSVHSLQELEMKSTYSQAKHSKVAKHTPIYYFIANKQNNFCLIALFNNILASRTSTIKLHYLN